jgi:DNA-directed RNA polymerase subunit M/transcription elongation factor TFIIS
METEANKAKEKPSCPKCGNRLRVLPDQIGTTVRCPKCNAKFVIGGSRQKARSSAAKAESASSAAPALDDEAYLPEIPLKRSTIVPEEPTPLVPEAHPSMVPEEPRPLATDEPAILPEEQMSDVSPYAAQQSAYEVDWRTADDVEMEAPHERPPVGEELHLEKARRRGLVREYDAVNPPKWTFFSGVFSYPWRGVNLSRWTAMSFGLSLAGLASFKVLEYVGLMNGLLTNLAVQGLVLSMFAIVITLGALSFAAASCQAAIQDTADGHDLPQEASLPEWDHWVITFLAWLSLWAAAGAIGFPLSLAIGPAAFLITAALFFPILLLSAMECDSYIVPFSPPVLRTLGYFWHGWLMFYLLTTGMIAGWVVAFDFCLPQAPNLTVLLSGPVLAAIMLIYARLLGRVAWRASGAPAAPVEREEPTQPADASSKGQWGGRKKQAKQASRTKRKRRRSIQIEIPDEIEAPDRRQQPPPRISFHLRP